MNSLSTRSGPKRELRGLVAGEIAGQTVIIPIWLGVSEHEVRAFSPPLADTIAVKTSGITAEQVAIVILKRVRPDIYEAHPRPELEKMLKGEALQELQTELTKVKDELRELIATEFRNIVRFTCNKVISIPIQPSDIRHAMTPQGMQEREARQKIAREISSTVLEAAEDYLRQAQARVVEKSDPERAQFIRNFKPTF